MRKVLLLALIAVFALPLRAQDPVAAAAAAIAAAQKAKTEEAPKPTYWSNSLMTQLNFAQATYSNWSKGGNNNVSFSAYVDAVANYAKDKKTWKNRLQLDYGLLYSQDKPIIQKNKDRILLESTWGYKAAKTLNYAAKFTFLNQFSNGFTYGTPSVENPAAKDWKDARSLKSGFLSPAIITLGLGMDWVPGKALSVNFSPLTGGFTVVDIASLRANNGMTLRKKYSELPAEEILPEHYRRARFEFGAQLTADAMIRVNDNFDASTHLVLFSNYLDNPQNLRVNWDNRIIWKIAKFFTLSLTTNLVYDDKVLIVDEKFPEGRRCVQFLEGVQFGFTYTFAKK